MRLRNVGTRVALVGGAVALIARAAGAQTQAAIAVSAGTATDQVGQRASALAVTPQLAFGWAGGVTGRVGATATRYASQAWALGGLAELAARERIAPGLFLALSGSAGTTTLRGPATGIWTAAELTPALELSVARVSAFGGFRAAAGSSTEARPLPGLPFGGQGMERSRVARSGRGPSYGAQLALIQSPARALSVGVREDRLVVGGNRYADRVAVIAFEHGAARVSATAGTRGGSVERASLWSAAASLPIASAISLELAAARYGINPVLGTPGGEHATAGLSWRLPVAREWTPPRAAAPPPQHGYTRLAMRDPRARQVELAGDFTEWKPVAALRAENGVWYVDLVIRPGRYRYAFRVDGSTWRVPDGATAVDDGFGGKSAWLTVNEPGER